MTQLSSGQKAHKVGTEKLEALGFDPLDELVAQYQEISDQLELAVTNPKMNPSQVQKLQELKNRILETLLPYKYGKAPVVTVHDTDRTAPLRIILMEDS